MSKHKIKKTDLKAFFSTVDMLMANRYHALYEELGFKKGKNKNFYCIEEATHSRGRDANPSMSVNNETGQWHCFTCEIKGNFQSYWRDYIKRGDDSYIDFLIETLKMSDSEVMRFSTDANDPDFEENSRQLRELYHNLQNERLDTKGKPHIMSGELSKMIRDLNKLPMEELDQMVQTLLADEDAKAYLYQTRRITEEIIKTYKIGLVYKRGERKYVFPTINAEGDFVNAKAYGPGSNIKWFHLYSGRDFLPVPINNFTKPKIYFFEGEPDLYCALSFKIDGAVTMGSKGKNDVNEVFGRNRAKQLFLGKEIVIVFDSDEASKKPAQQLAESLHPYAKQVKVIDLNKSDINPHGLDPNLMKEVVSKDKNNNDVVKSKRAEKDFTEFMQKNGFGEEAKKKFHALVDATPVFTTNIDRKRKDIYKVTVYDCLKPEYYSADRSKELELVASVSEFNHEAYMYPTEVEITCPVMKDPNKARSHCKNCFLKDYEEFKASDHMNFKIVREHSKETAADPMCSSIRDHDILGLIQVTEAQKQQNLKKMHGIPDSCRICNIVDVKTEKLTYVRLGKDISEYEEVPESGSEVKGDIDVEAYIQGPAVINQNQSYKFKGVQTTAWNGQQVVLFIDQSDPIETSIESFKMDQDVHDILTVFRPKEGESIDEHIKRRHGIFAHAAGVTGREDLFLINDLAYMSPLEVKNPMLPTIKRGWVEVLIAGDPRTGKTIVSKFFHKHYKIGKIIGGSSGVSRSGLIGGAKKVGKRDQVSWGAFVMGDGGMIIIDEMSEIDVKTLTDLGDIRSEGVAKLDMIVSGRERARTRKIMLSNPRGAEDKQKEYNYGIQFLKDLCIQERILARFDIAYIVKSGDVDVKTFASNYQEITSEFNEFQCRQLIMWAHSRKATDVIYEDGFNDMVNDLNIKMNEEYDSSTQLVNQEQRAKLTRLSIALASMLYSTPENDCSKILVKKEHLEYIYNFLNKIYRHPNMRMDDYSKMIKESRTLGSMEFMKNICKYIDIRPLIREAEFTEKSLQHIFIDFLDRVRNGRCYITDAKSDERKSTGLSIFESTPKLIGLMTSRNCIERSGRGMFKKTPMFTEWLTKREKLGDEAEQSNILEPEQNESNSSIIEKTTKLRDSGESDKKRRTG